MKRGDALGRVRRQRRTKERRARNAGDAVRSAGKRLPIGQNNAHDLAEPERDDGEIVAAQTQHRKAEQDTHKTGEHTGERQTFPKRKIEIYREQRVTVSADRVERYVTHIKQTS